MRTDHENPTRAYFYSLRGLRRLPELAWGNRLLAAGNSVSELVSMDAVNVNANKLESVGQNLLNRICCTDSEESADSVDQSPAVGKLCGAEISARSTQERRIIAGGVAFGCMSVSDDAALRKLERRN